MVKYINLKKIVTKTTPYSMLYIYYGNNNQSITEVAILISGKADIRKWSIIRDKEGHYTIKKGSFHQEDIIILNTCAPNNRVSKYVKLNVVFPYNLAVAP